MAKLIVEVIAISAVSLEIDEVIAFFFFFYGYEVTYY